jgi:hypothetical protein
VRFQDAARDARAVVYSSVQSNPLVARAASILADAGQDERLLARAVMNGETNEPGPWRAMFPSLFSRAPDDPRRSSAETILALALDVAGRGDEIRSQFRGAIVEELAQRLIARRVDGAAVRRERRILFDGVPAEIHPYDVTVERDAGPEAWDCKWGARGIGTDVLHQLDDARRHAAGEGIRLRVGLIVFDARRSCVARMVRQTAPTREIRLITIETLDQLAGARPQG